MKRVARILLCALLSSILIVPVSNAFPDTALLTICTSLKSGYQLISKTEKCNERIYETRTWFQKGSAPSGTPGSTKLDMRTCISKSSKIQIIRTRSTCNSTTTTTALWQRPLGPPVAPSITSVVMGLLGTATLNITAPTEDGGARVTSYLVTSSPAAVAATYTPVQIKAAKITGLTPGSSYSFSVVAINIKGPSPSSIASASTLAPTIPSAPSITKVIATGTNSAQLSFSAPLDNGGLPITSYVATSNPGSLQTIVYQSASGTINITNLSHSTTYTFTLKAINAAGSSLPSSTSPSITTATPPPPPEPVAVAPALAAPGFSLSSSSETRTVNTAATGFTISSTGGAIASFAISATPAGMSFSTSTGALSGTPNTVASATTYTITATNASGSATQTFTLTVITAVPAFTLSSSSETRTVNTAATGFTISSTGGAIASFAISATPAGMSFSTSTGALSGTPNTVASATTYTITATNASGSATQTFTLTVTAVVYTVGDTGPGGGKIIYYSESGFNCGPEFSSTGSPTGGKCNYLEVAPTGWNNPAASPAASDTQTVWAIGNYAKQGILEINDDLSAYNNVLGVGLGYKNSELIVAQNGTYDSDSNKYAAGEARAYRGNSKDDWYLPTTAELNLMCQWARAVSPDVTIRCTGGVSAIDRGFQQNIYLSSSEELYRPSAGYWRVWAQTFNGGVQTSDHLKSSPLYVRPVRAF